MIFIPNSQAYLDRNSSSAICLLDYSEHFVQNWITLSTLFKNKGRLLSWDPFQTS